MDEGLANPYCCSNEHLLIIGVERYASSDVVKVMDLKKKAWKNVKFLNDYGEIASMTILGDRLYVVSSKSYDYTRYSTVSTCFTSALLESQPSDIEQPLVWHKVHPIADLYKPFLANLCGNLVAIGGNMSVKTYSPYNERTREQYFTKPKLYVYSDEVNIRGWKFVADLPTKNGYPNMDFLVATLQGDRLIVCGGDYFVDVEDDDIITTDIVHVGLYQ